MEMELELQTPRLVLRPPRREDFDDWATLMADPEAARFLGGAQTRPVAWRGFMSVAGAWHMDGYAMFSVIEKASGRWIGRVGPWCPEGWPGPEIGWAILRDCWGRGYATEAAIASAQWAFATLGWSEIVHVISPDNLASQAVARRLGSYNRGPGRLPPPYEHSQIDVWGQRREQWYAAHSRSV